MEENKKAEKSAAALREESVLRFWKENKIFDKTLEKESPKGDFIFYEGPPGANGVPMLHHFEARAFKDIIPRYKTMQGFHVDRRAGWDCHGLPVELQAEKELGIASKKDIEQFGIEKYNAYCRELVTRYIHDWDIFTERMGYWIDNNRAYYTMDSNFIESSWNIIAKAHERGFLYQDYKILPWCARCGTGLSSHELGQPGVYVDVKDLSVTAKFKIVGVDNGYFLAWTTTPWTLPGNVGLAVGSDIVYVEIKIQGSDEVLVLAKERLSILTEPYEIVAEHTGSEMVGMQYEPLYPYLAELDKGDEKLANAYKVYTADFVTTTDGTGIVHTAVMYGADDFDLGTKVGLPKFHIVDPTGHFIQGVGIFAGRFVKDEDVAIDVIKDLAHRGLLFKKEKYEHAYPHCWRCKTPLIYYARSSWYFAMSKLREQMVARNQTINWEPAHIKDGRFGEWLRDAKDWAISRERYWGTPLPVWIAEDGEKLVVDSFETLKKYTKKSGNKYFVMRHGQAQSNLTGVWNSLGIEENPLTDDGKQMALDAAKKYDGNFDVIIASPLLRTKMTAEIVAGEKGIDPATIIFDDRIREFNPGVKYQGKELNVFTDLFAHYAERFTSENPEGETYRSMKKRMMDALYDYEQTYKGKRILIVSHGGPILNLFLGSQGILEKETVDTIENIFYLKNAEIRQLDFVPLPHNENYELDPHRPFIDNVVLEKDGKKFTRIKEVMDVWFDSGAMPLAQDHYPFANKEKIDNGGYPADFISEAIDQTRGWFYTLVAVSALIDRPAPFQNAICLGHLLDAEGQKMSKSKGNVINPWEQMDKFGADAVRMWMYSVTQPGDSKNYDEKVVREFNNKIFGLLGNVVSFYKLYRDVSLESTVSNLQPVHVLDQWILSRLHQFTKLVTESLDAYKIFEPARGFRDFVDDLSTWYLRRSRDRLKDGDREAKQTLYVVLKTLAKLLAPFAPFTAEEIWQELKLEHEEESIHLASWPIAGEISEQLRENMQLVRDLCAVGHALRSKAGIPVRQVLATFFVTEDLTDAYKEIMKDEMNVKAIEKGPVIIFDERITPELKREGQSRELIRAIQDLRKKSGLNPDDVITLSLSTNEIGKAIIESFAADIQKVVNAKEIVFGENEGEEIKIDEVMFKIKI